MNLTQLTTNYADDMANLGRAQAQSLMANELALILADARAETLAAIETALTIAFLNGARTRGEQIAASMVKMAENAGEGQ